MTRASLVRFTSVGLIWGTSYTFIKLADNGLTPSQVVLGRLIAGLAALLVIMGFRGVRLPRLGVFWAHSCVAAILGMVAPFLLLAWGEHYTSAAMAGVLSASLPLCTLAAVTVLLPADRASWQMICGLVAGFSGVILTLAPWQSIGGTLGGQFAVLGSVVCYALQAVYVRRFFATRVPALAVAAAQLLVATILQGVITPAMTWHTPHLTWKVAVSIGVLGVLGSAVAYVLYFRLIADSGATTAASVNYLVPIVALLSGVLLLDEQVTWNMLLGVALVLGGLTLPERQLPALRLGKRARADTGRAVAEAGQGRAGEPEDGQVKVVAGAE